MCTFKKNEDEHLGFLSTYYVPREYFLNFRSFWAKQISVQNLAAILSVCVALGKPPNLQTSVANLRRYYLCKIILNIRK